MTKYLKTYSAITSGTMGGRDDGYPYTATVLYEDMEQLAKYHGTKPNEKYYELAEMDEVKLVAEVEAIKERLKDEKEKAELAVKYQQLESLKKELGEE